MDNENLIRKTLRLDDYCKKEKLTVEDYKESLWPDIKNNIYKALSTSESISDTYTFESFYRNLLKIIHSGLSDVLLNDMDNLLSDYYSGINLKLMREFFPNTTIVAPTKDQALKYLMSFNHVLNSYNNSLDYTLLICFRVNNLMTKEDFNEIFKKAIVDKHIQMLIPLMADLQSKAFSVNPDVMQKIVVSLYAICPDYANILPCLFERFISNLNPLHLSHLELYRKEVIKMCQDLRTHPEFHGDQSKKRRYSES